MRRWSRQLDAFHCLATRQKRKMFSLCGHYYFPWHSTGWFSVACCPSGSCSCGSWRTRVVTSRAPRLPAQSVSICCHSFAYEPVTWILHHSALYVGLAVVAVKDHEQLMAVWGIICRNRDSGIQWYSTVAILDRSMCQLISLSFYVDHLWNAQM